MALVFQYGSNCSWDRLNGLDRLGGAAMPICIAFVEDYQLSFAVWSTKNNCAAATIVEAPGKRVWGVLYDVPDERLHRDTTPPGKRSFDEIEGDRYYRRFIRVQLPHGDTMQVLTYVAKRPPQDGIRTNTEYVRHIVKGLRERGVSEEYVREVKAIAAENNPDIRDELEAL